MADPDDKTGFVTELSSGFPRGTMTLRYGFLHDAQRKVTQFRLDTDRFIDRDFDVGEVQTLLDGFSTDIFQVFIAAAGPQLLAWMKEKS